MLQVERIQATLVRKRSTLHVDNAVLALAASPSPAAVPLAAPALRDADAATAVLAAPEVPGPVKTALATAAEDAPPPPPPPSSDIPAASPEHAAAPGPVAPTREPEASTSLAVRAPVALPPRTDVLASTVDGWVRVGSGTVAVPESALEFLLRHLARLLAALAGTAAREATAGHGDAAARRRRSRFDVNGVLCPFELHGVCNDPGCRFEHLCGAAAADGAANPPGADADGAPPAPPAPLPAVAGMPMASRVAQLHQAVLAMGVPEPFLVEGMPATGRAASCAASDASRLRPRTRFARGAQR